MITGKDGRRRGSTAGSFLIKELGCQSAEEMFCDALAILGIDRFRELCAELNKDRPIWSRIADITAQSPHRELVVKGALEEIVVHVRESEDCAQSSPLRAEVRQTLTKIADAMDRVAGVLRDNEVSAAAGPDIEPVTINGIWLNKARALLAAKPASGGGSLSVRDETAVAWNQEKPAANDNISVREIERILQIVLTADSQAAGCAGPATDVTTNHGKTANQRVQALLMAVEQWVCRRLDASTNGTGPVPEDAKLLDYIRQVSEDARFLIDMQALGRHSAVIGRDANAPPAPVVVSKGADIAQILQYFRAQWVPGGTDVVSSRGMRALSNGIRKFAEYHLQPHRGSRKLTDALDAPRGRQLCAVAATDLFEAERGWKPAHDNPEVQRLCAIIWRLAGFALLPGQQGTDNNDSAWSRPLRKTRKSPSFFALFDSRFLILGILQRNQIAGQRLAAE